MVRPHSFRCQFNWHRYDGGIQKGIVLVGTLYVRYVITG